MSAPRYCPFYCEENLWWLAADPRVGPGRRRVLIVSNAQRKVALWNQRAGAPEQDGLVVCDYHVVLLCDDALWDLDTTLGAPLPLSDYLRQTFRGAPDRFAPRFRVMDADLYRGLFASDRRHMRTKGGGFQEPPPPWPPIGEGNSLEALLDFEREEPGMVVDLPGLLAWVA